MKELLYITEGFRSANITTMYRAGLCIAVVSKPGITNDALAKLMSTTREAIRVAVRGLEEDKLVYVEKIKHKDNRPKATKVYPTPYLKDVTSRMVRQIAEWRKNEQNVTQTGASFTFMNDQAE